MTPLIARQGEQKQWHFAHASRSVYERTDNECQYSFFVSVRMMARQVIGDSLEIVLPEYQVVESLFVDELGDYLTERLVVTHKKRVRLESIEIEREFHSNQVDVFGKIERYPFVVYFTHPGRDVPVELKSLRYEKCGAIEISLSDTYSLFTGDGADKQTYLDKLRRFLIEDVPSKRWVYHPRYSSTRDRARNILKLRREELLRNRFEQYGSTTSIGSIPETIVDLEEDKGESKREVRYQCLVCGTAWIGMEPGYNPCPKCKTHLYGKRLGYIDNET